MNKRLFSILVCALLPGAAWAQITGVVAAPPRGATGVPAAGMKLAEVAAIGEQLWLRGSEGRLVEVDLATGARQTVAESGVVDMVKADGRLLTLRQQGDAYRIEVSAGAPRREFPVIPAAAGDPPRVLAVSGETVVVLGERTVWRLEAGSSGWSGFALGDLVTTAQFASNSNRASALRGAVMPADRDALYLAYGMGEFGGGLVRVDLKTGDRTIKQSAPVTGVIADPRRADCVITSSGLTSNGGSGGVSRVCGAESGPVFEEALPSRSPLPFPFSETLPIDRMADGQGGFWALAGFVVNNGGEVLMFDPDGKVQDRSKITFTKTGGVTLDRGGPGWIAVLEDDDFGWPVGGRMPLLATQD
ncbi:MAG: hypothetical protein JWM33_1549 [Caulobacteraceae bacterium]|nr:hypothetical protein [Caulobacteraceae bacterium]